MTPQFLVLARSWAQAYGSTWPGPCLQKARPAAACSPSRVSASEGCSLLPEPARRLKLGLGGAGSCTQPSDQDPGKSQERRLPPGKGAGGRASASPFTSMPRVGKVGRARFLTMNARDALPDPPHPPAPLPALAPYLEKLRDFPPGQILLGIVGVHGCAARALGTGGEAPRLRRPGLALAGSGMSTVKPPLSRANTRSARPAQARDPPLPLPRGCGLRAPAAPASVPATEPGLRARSNGFPGSQAAPPPGEGRREWRREDRAADARQLPARLSCSARGALRLQEPRLRRRPVTQRGQARGCGGGDGRARGPVVTPLHAAPPPWGRSNLGPGGQKNRVGAFRNLRSFRFSGPFSLPSTLPPPHTHTVTPASLRSSQEKT